MPKTTARTQPSRLLSLGNFRGKLSSESVLPQLALLAILVGVKTALVMILFRLFIEVGSDSLLGINRENFETLDIVIRFISPIAGPLLIGLLLFRLRADKREAGVAQVMGKLSDHRPRPSAVNALVPFIAGGVTLLGGREGPAIHVGAAGASVLEAALELPYNSIRILVACGAAAANASSFNTPIARVTSLSMLGFSRSLYQPISLPASRFNVP